MFNTLTSFYKRHKKKIWVTGILAGSAYAIGNFCLSKYDEWKNSKMNEVWIETKKKHHFENNQQTCTTTYMELLPNLRNTITEKLDIEHFLELLKTKPPNKLDIWEKLKIYCFVQLICSAISSAIMLVFLKVQLNILAGYLFVDSLGSEGTEKKEISNDVKLKYLRNVRYLIDSGVAEMLNDCQNIAEGILNDVRLDEKLSHEKLKEIVKTIIIKLKENKNRSENEMKHSFCSYLIDPNWLCDTLTEDDYVKMTSQMVDILQGTDCCRVIDNIVNDGVDEVLKQCSMYFPEPDGIEINSNGIVDNTNKPTPIIPTAKLIPKLNFHIHEIFKDGRNDFMDNIYANPLLRQFTENIYEAFSQEYT